MPATSAMADSARRRVRLCITVDLEADVPHRVKSDLGIRRLDQLIAVLSEYDIESTFFTVGSLATSHPTTILDLSAAGHEIGSHGWNHEPYGDTFPTDLGFDRLSDCRASELVKRSVAELSSLTGRAVSCFRSPYLSFSPRMIPLLASHGVLVDSSFRLSHPLARTQPRWIQAKNAGIVLEVPVLSGHAGITAKTLRVSGWRCAANSVETLVKQSRGVPVLVFLCHPWEFVANPPWRHHLPRVFWEGSESTLDRFRSLLTWIYSRYEVEAHSIGSLYEVYSAHPPSGAIKVAPTNG